MILEQDEVESQVMSEADSIDLSEATLSHLAVVEVADEADLDDESSDDDSEDSQQQAEDDEQKGEQQASSSSDESHEESVMRAKAARNTIVNGKTDSNSFPFKRVVLLTIVQMAVAAVFYGGVAGEKYADLAHGGAIEDEPPFFPHYATAIFAAFVLNVVLAHMVRLIGLRYWKHGVVLGLELFIAIGFLPRLVNTMFDDASIELMLLHQIPQVFLAALFGAIHAHYN